MSLRLRPGRGPTALLVAATAVVLRLPLLTGPSRPDEAGYLLVARTVRRGGPFLYGDLWVDRPPLLVLAFRLADATGGLAGVRLLGLLAAAVLAGAAADAGWTLAGRPGAAAAGVVAAALQASPLLSAPDVDGELLALPFVLCCIATGLRATRAEVPQRQVLLLGSAGLLGSTALMVKQNVVDGLVLLGLLLLVRAVRRELAARRAVLLLASTAAGAVVPLLGLALWAGWWGATPTEVYGALVGFRSASLQVIASQDLGAPTRRAVRLAEVAVLSGIGPLLLLPARRRPDRSLRIAVLLTAAVGLASIGLGGSYWAHYLLQLLPAAALTAALTARPLRGVGSRLAVALVVGSAVLAVAVQAVPARARDCGGQAARAAETADWLRAHAARGDTGLTLFGAADVLLDSGIEPAYPYLWSLPVRTLDPDLALLSASLRGPAAATWVVRTVPLESWGLDDGDRLSTELARGYRRVATVCGQDVFHRKG